MKARWLIPVGLALGLGLALCARDAAPDLGPDEPRQTAAASTASAPAPAAPKPAAREDAPTPAQPRIAEPVAPPETVRSWALPLELGWSGAAVGTPLVQVIAFRPPASRPHDVTFQARVTDASGACYLFDVPVPGLLPLELAQAQDEALIGDTVLTARGALLFRLPDVPFPASVTFVCPDGQVAATVGLSLVGGQPAACVLQ